MIKASLKIAGLTYKSEGETIKDAILNLKPKVNRTTSVLTITKDGKDKWKVLTPMTTYSVFGERGQTVKDIALKGLLARFE